MFGRIKKSIQSSRRRAQILAEAREVLADLGGHWVLDAGKPVGERAEMLLEIGLMHLKAVKMGQEMARKVADQFKEARWAPVKEASRN